MPTVDILKEQMQRKERCFEVTLICVYSLASRLMEKWGRI